MCVCACVCVCTRVHMPPSYRRKGWYLSLSTQDRNFC